MLWKLLLPTSLSSLQVAFEVDDGLYEVHRLTKTRADSKALLKLPRVGLGITAYLMAMAGIRKAVISTQYCATWVQVMPFMPPRVA